MPRYRRVLRVTWTVGWGFLAVLLVVLWVRSYWRMDGCSYGWATESLIASSQNGVITMTRLYEPNGTWISSQAVLDPPGLRDHFGVGWFDYRPTNIAAICPHWLFILLFAVAAITPWLGSRFTVKSLLIVTTCLAVLLGVLTFVH